MVWQKTYACLIVSLMFCGAGVQLAQAEEQQPRPILIRSKSATPLTSATEDTTVPATPAGTTQFESLIAEGTALMNTGKADAAYQLLEPHDFDYSGNVRFDYLFGIAALDSGRPDKATLAFERVLAVDPDFAGARLDMARAYFQLGDLPRAKSEFEAVLKQEPPEAARRVIAQYLQAIADAERAKRTRLGAYVEASLGRDTNVNNSTSQAEIPVPAFNNMVFTLSPTNLKTPDYFYGAAAGADVSHDFNENWGVYGGLDYRRRGHKEMTAFDSASLDGRGGISYRRGDDMWRIGGSYNQFQLDQALNRRSYALNADWKHAFDAQNQLNVFGQYGLNRFAASGMKINDFNQLMLGGGLLHLLADGKTAVYAMVNLANEVALEGRADGNKSGYGLRLGGQTVFGESVEAYVNAGYQTGRYSVENVAFLTTRSDRLVDATLGMAWHPDKAWTLRPQLSYSRNNSNIPIYSFDRIEASLSVRRDFR